MNHDDNAPQSAALPTYLRRIVGRILRWIPWGRLLIIVATGLLSYFLVPLILVRYSETKSLHDARVARGIKLEDYNADFDAKMNGIRTLMSFFADHNQRFSGADLKETKKALFKDFRDRYLIDINATIWYWPQDFQREVVALNLLAPAETEQLKADIQE